MRQTQLFTKTRREAPKGEEAKNAKLLIRGGFINKEMAGVYDYLPLGLRVLKKIENIIREEMNAIGGQEILMTTLQDPEIWKKTARWDDQKIDNWFKTNSKYGGDYGLAFTHEEPITNFMTNHVNSYKDLPFAVYQFQNKFRDEKRSKGGILRGREFLMKDLYSFHSNNKSLDEFYEKCAIAYEKIFAKCNIGDITFKTFASGGMFSKWSHEFQTVCDVGEDVVYVDEEKKIAVNKEVYTDEVLAELKLNKNDLMEKKSIEVGNIFKLGSRFSEELGLKIKDKEGESKSVIMGSYGIGLGRLMGTVVETLSDDKGMVWPTSIAPFGAHLIEIAGGDTAVKEKTEQVYKKMSENMEVLYDDRDLRAGEKFADADLLGIPKQIIVGQKGV
ncbi:MAG: aminoacyl--tRNA ligase-related protein, partial [Patescibacteria group bacterium]